MSLSVDVAMQDSSSVSLVGGVDLGRRAQMWAKPWRAFIARGRHHHRHLESLCCWSLIPSIVYSSISSSQYTSKSKRKAIPGGGGVGSTNSAQGCFVF